MGAEIFPGIGILCAISTLVRVLAMGTEARRKLLRVVAVFSRALDEEEAGVRGLRLGEWGPALRTWRVRHQSSRRTHSVPDHS